MEPLKTLPIWVTWKKLVREGKTTKPPFQPSGQYASSTNPSTWCTFKEAEEAIEKDGVGIVFEPENRVVGVDFDAILFDSDPSTIPEAARAFLDAANSYVEYSPSKTGIHVLFQLTEHIDLLANKHTFDSVPVHASFSKPPQVEVYTGGRFFTYSADPLPGSKPVRLITPEEFTSLLAVMGYPWKETTTSTQPIQDRPATSTLSDEELLSRMFAAKNGSKISTLYSGDLSKHNNDASSGDFALLMHLAFWSQKDAEQMKRLWLASPLGDREKVQKREDYQNRSIQNAIDATTEVFTPTQFNTDKVNVDVDFDFITKTNKDGSIVIPCMLPNILRVLRKHPKFNDRFRRNMFSNMTEAFNETTGKWETLTDIYLLRAREFISENFPAFSKVGRDIITDAVLTASYDNQINPPRDYFTSLTWDKTPRLNSWLHSTYGVPDDNLYHAIGSNWLKGLVKRVMIPGCQFDEALALESPQGWRKSTSIRVLGAPWHVETAHSIDNKDFYILLAQNVIVEFSEGEIFDRTSMKKIKAEITKTEDQFRPPYERGMVKFPRSCVFVVTTNELELKDDTGNRRWLPVKLEKPADIDWLTKNKDQLFAEAYHRAIIMKETSHEYPNELTLKQEESAEWSGYDEKTVEWYAGLSDAGREAGVSVHDACDKVFASDKTTRRDEMQMGGILKRTLHLEKRNKSVGGATFKRWFPTERSLKLIDGVFPQATPIPNHNNNIPF